MSSCCLRFPACHTWAPSHEVSLTQTVGCYTWLSSLTTRAGCCGIKHIITSLGTIRVSLQLGAAASFIPTTVWISTIQACEFRSYLKIYISDSVASVSTRITFYRVVRQVDKTFFFFYLSPVLDSKTLFVSSAVTEHIRSARWFQRASLGKKVLYLSCHGSVGAHWLGLWCE